MVRQLFAQSLALVALLAGVYAGIVKENNATQQDGTLPLRVNAFAGVGSDDGSQGSSPDPLIIHDQQGSDLEDVMESYPCGGEAKVLRCRCPTATGSQEVEKPEMC